MRKKLDTRFPAARIKKIMQTDEDVGKIQMAVPVLVSKALELFLQDLCDSTYNITLQRGMKTISSQHLKQCVHNFNHYDFLREIVSKVPDLGNSEGSSGEGRFTQRRRTAEEEEHEDPLKKAKILQDAGPAYNASSSTGTSSGTGRGRGRPRGSGRGRRGGARGAERDASHYYEEDPGPLNTDEVGPTVPSDSAKENPGPVRNFDLNVDFSENVPAHTGSSAPTEPQPLEMIQDKQQEYPGWSMDDMKKMAVDPVQFALTHQKVDEEEEDYDNEDD